MALTRVKYLGMSDIRIMSKKDLADAGVSVDGQLRWDRSNGYSVVVQDPSDRLIEVLKEESAFTIEELDEESGKNVQTIVKGSRMDDTAATVVDGTTGQASTRTTGRTGRGSSTGGTTT